MLTMVDKVLTKIARQLTSKNAIIKLPKKINGGKNYEI